MESVPVWRPSEMVRQWGLATPMRKVVKNLTELSQIQIGGQT